MAMLDVEDINRGDIVLVEVKVNRFSPQDRQAQGSGSGTMSVDVNTTDITPTASTSTSSVTVDDVTAERRARAGWTRWNAGFQLQAISLLHSVSDEDANVPEDIISADMDSFEM